MNHVSNQGELWSSGAEDWRIQEATFKPLYDKILRTFNFGNEFSLLDIGCGTGFFLSLLAGKNCRLTGVDISKNAIAIAKKSLPNAQFKIGEMENLPFPDQSFDFTIANNSLQYAKDFKRTLKEIHRVLKPKGKAIFSLWDNPEKSDSFSYFKVFYALTNQDPGNSIPFNLSQTGQVESLLTNAGFLMGDRIEVRCPRSYPNSTIALKGILSSGPAKYAIKKTSREKLSSEVMEAIKPFQLKNGGYKLANSFFFISGTKRAN